MKNKNNNNQALGCRSHSLIIPFYHRLFTVFTTLLCMGGLPAKEPVFRFMVYRRHSRGHGILWKQFQKKRKEAILYFRQAKEKNGV